MARLTVEHKRSDDFQKGVGSLFRQKSYDILGCRAPKKTPDPVNALKSNSRTSGPLIVRLRVGQTLLSCPNHGEGNDFAQTEMSVPPENTCLTKH